MKKAAFFTRGQLFIRRLLQLTAVITTGWNLSLRLVVGLPGVRIFVDLFQSLCGQMRVNLGG